MTPVQIANSSRIEKVTFETLSNNVSRLNSIVLGKTDDNYPKEGDFVESQKFLSLAEFFTKSGFEVVDKRQNSGALWVVGTKQELEEAVNKAASLFNAYGTYCDGGRAVGYRKAWFTKCKE